MANLLLHSLKEFDEVIFGIAERLELSGVLEIGAETGVFSEKLLNLFNEVITANQ